MSSFNGAGVFSISGAGQPYVSGTTISSSVANQLGTDLANGLSTCLLKDGTQTATAIIPFALGLSSGALVDISSGTAGQIKFPATQNASANANTLDDYEEGTWTPTDASGAGLSLTAVSCRYFKIGSMVTIMGTLVYPGNANGANVNVGGLPYTTLNEAAIGGCFAIAWGNATTAFGIPATNNTYFAIQDGAFTPFVNLNFSGKTVRFQFSYQATA